jgi:hypothetical protein
MQRIHRQDTLTGRAAASAPEANLQTVEELKQYKGPLLNAETAPLSSRQVMDLIRAARSTDDLRLNGPQNVTKPSHFALQRFVSKGSLAKQDELSVLIREASTEFSKESLQFMNAALEREKDMLELVKSLLETVDQIQNRVVGSQEG